MKISVVELSKAYGGHDIFQNFSLEVETGMRLCVCGPNGTGKSTLLGIMAGVEEPDSGRVILPKGCRLGYVEQELSEQSLNSTLIEYVMDSIHDWSDFWSEWKKASDSGDKEKLASLMTRQTELEHSYGYNPEQRAKEVLTGLGFNQDKWTMPLKQLSGGWQERAKLARVLTAGADVLLLDEPTNHLDMDAVEWLEDFLMKFEGSLVFVAHDRRFMDKIGNHILYLGSSKPVFRKAGYSQFLVLQEEFEVQKNRQAKALRDEYDRKMAFVERFRAKATKARQAGSRQKMAKKLEKQLEDYRPEPKRRELNFVWPKAPHSEKQMLTAEKLDFHFPDGKRMWPPLDFTIYNGSRIALTGPNGAGKSTLLKLIAGKLDKSGGALTKSPQMRLGYYSQSHMETLKPEASVLSEMRRLSDPRMTEEELMSVLGLFMLGQEYFDRPVSALSGGEKSRLVLASLFLKQCNFLLLDEPTNNLDLESREALAKALKKYDGTLMLVAHDRWLLSQIDAEIWDLGPDGITAYDTYQEYEAHRYKSASQIAEAPVKKNPATVPAASREEQKKLKRQQAEQRNTLHKIIKPLQENYNLLEKELEEILIQQSSLEKDLADSETYKNREKATSLMTAYEQNKKKADDIMEKMIELETSINDHKNLSAPKHEFSA